ncbi:MAG: TIGR00725 family protein [Pseudonocardiales bacterium]|nr:MAG: TIGR00725 family protein [Pseudonocardiales bacterium]
MSGEQYVAVVGPADASEADIAAAYATGAALAARGAVVICGGMGGVMSAVAAGVRSAGGLCVGLLPGDSREGASPDLTVALPTGLGEVRNALVVRAADALVAIGGSWGTMSEIALAVRSGRPAVAVGGWQVVDASGSPVDGVIFAGDPGEAVEAVLALPSTDA